jgi:hypothetical protein
MPFSSINVYNLGAKVLQINELAKFLGIIATFCIFAASNHQSNNKNT